MCQNEYHKHKYIIEGEIYFKLLPKRGDKYLYSVKREDNLLFVAYKRENMAPIPPTT